MESEQQFSTLQNGQSHIMQQLGLLLARSPGTGMGGGQLAPQLQRGLVRSRDEADLSLSAAEMGDGGGAMLGGGCSSGFGAVAGGVAQQQPDFQQHHQQQQLIQLQQRLRLQREQEEVARATAAAAATAVHGESAGQNGTVAAAGAIAATTLLEKQRALAQRFYATLTPSQQERWNALTTEEQTAQLQAYESSLAGSV